jgi:hypothetical protein
LKIFIKKKWSGVRISGQKRSGPDFKDGKEKINKNQEFLSTYKLEIKEKYKKLMNFKKTAFSKRTIQKDLRLSK